MAIMAYIKLCDRDIKGSVQCGALNGCAAGGTCYSYHIWTGTSNSTGVYGVPALANGIIDMVGGCGSGFCPSTLAFSVR